MELNRIIRYIDGQKQDAAGRTYYPVDLVDDRGNIKGEDVEYISPESESKELTVNLKSASGGGHEWIISYKARRPVPCRSQHCNICERYYPQ